MPRPRKRRRRLVLVTLGVLVVGWIGWMGLRAITATPTPIIDYAALLRERSASLQPEGEDGWPHYLAALEAYETARGEMLEAQLEAGDARTAIGGLTVVEAAFNFDNLLGSGGDPEVLDHERAALVALEAAGVSDHLARLAAAPRAVRPIAGGPPLVQLLLPTLATARQVTRTQVASMNAAIAAGDADRAVDAFEHAMALGRTLGSQQCLIDALVAIAIHQLTLGRLRDAMVTHPGVFDAATCRRLLAALDRQGRIHPADHWLECERLSLKDTIQNVFSDDGHGDGRLDTQKLGGLGVMPGAPVPTGGNIVSRALGALTSLTVAGRRETTRVADEIFDQAVADAKRTATGRAATPFDMDTAVQSLSRRHVLLRMMLPAIDRAIDICDVHRTSLAGTRIMLAVHAHADEHGAFPATLAELVPTYLDVLPADPVHGGAFIYRRLDDDPLGRPYVLYSTGLDRNDDGGTPAPSNPDDAITRLRPGTDYVLNPPPADE